MTQWLVSPVQRTMHPNSGAGGHQVFVGQPTRHRGDVLAMSPGMQALVRVTVEHIFPNCPRYIHNLATGEISNNAPREGHVVDEPEWKSWPEWKEVLPGT